MAYKWVGANADGFDPEIQNAWGELPMKRGDIKDPDDELRGTAPKVIDRRKSQHALSRSPCLLIRSSIFQRPNMGHDLEDKPPTADHPLDSDRRASSPLPADPLRPLMRARRQARRTCPRAARRPTRARTSSTPGPSSLTRKRYAPGELGHLAREGGREGLRERERSDQTGSIRKGLTRIRKGW